MLSICSSLRYLVSVGRWKGGRLLRSTSPRPHKRVGAVRWGIPSSMNEDSPPLDYDPSGELLGLDVDPQPSALVPEAAKLRSWFGPNGQYIRELPCPNCRGRGYTPCTECGIERSRADCSQCNGKGLKTCRQCSGDCVIWEESYDERPWEKARSSSPFKVKEDDEVDNLEIKMDVTRKSKRIYQSPSPEVSLKISRSLRNLNAKTGLFSRRMKIIHRDPMLHAQRVAAIKKAKRTDAARKQASETMKAFFSDPENRLRRSIVMKGVKFYCSHCGQEGHRRHYCPTLKKTFGKTRLKCRLCGERGHNLRTCGITKSTEKANHSSTRHCRLCGENGHNRRTCPERTQVEVGKSDSQKATSTSISKKTYTCSLCLGKGHNARTCSNRQATEEIE